MDYNNSRGFEPEQEKKPNPWFSLWLQPRYTMRSILDSYNRGPIILIAVVSGITDALARISDRNTLDTLLGTLAAAMIGGIIGGFLGVYISAALLKWTGKWIGGQGTYDDILAAVSWSGVPNIWSLVLWTLGIIVFGNNFFSSTVLMLSSGILLKIIYWIIMLAIILVDIWSIFTAIKCVAEAQQFSSWRALGNFALSSAVVFVPLLLLLLIIRFI